MKSLAILLVAMPLTGAMVTGKVTDTAGRPVAGAIVSLSQSPRAKTRTTVSGDDGSYSILDIANGESYEIHADRKGMASTPRNLRVSSVSQVITLTLRMMPRILFEDVTAKTGIAFVLRNGETGQFYQPELMPGGLAAFDFNNDGCTDIFVTNGATLPAQQKTGPEYRNRLYRNNCDMTFTDVTGSSGLAGEGYSMGVAAADFDNDGRVDLLVTGVRGVTLYRNKGNGSFEDVTTHAGLATEDPQYGRMWSVSAGWFDYDNDGFPDLFVTNYVAWNPGTEPLCKFKTTRLYCHPGGYKGLPDQLFHNNGNGTFTDVSQASGIRKSIGKGMGVAFGDFNDDGLTDVFVANDSTANFLFRNLGDGTFREVGMEAGVALNGPGNAVAGMGADFRDYNNDGRDDIALDAMYWDGFTLYRNQGKPGFFTDDTMASGLVRATRNLTGWGMGIYDFDNDGNKDFFYATSHFPGTEPQVGVEPALANRVLRNVGNGVFEDVSVLAGIDFQQPGLFRGAAFADFDNDGRIDVAVTSLNGPLKVFRNVSPESGHWLALKLVGTKSNRDGLGAKVRLTLPGTRTLTNHATTSVGYASSSEPLIRFGLGPWGHATEIEIRWPSGRLQTLTNVEADRILTVREP